MTIKVSAINSDGTVTLLRPEPDDYVLQPNELDIDIVGYPNGLHLPKWDATNKQWVEGKTADEMLEINRTAKLAENVKAYEASLAKGFTSKADGTSRTYAIDPMAMSKWTGTLSNINAGTISSVNIKDFNGNKLTLNATQFKQMASDGFNFFQSQEQKMWDYEDQITQAQDQPTLDGITISF